MILFSNTKTGDSLTILIEYDEGFFKIVFHKKDVLSVPVKELIEVTKQNIKTSANINRHQIFKAVNHVVASLNDYYKYIHEQWQV